VNEASPNSPVSIEQVTGKNDFELFPQDKAMTFYTIDKKAMENDNTIIIKKSKSRQRWCNEVYSTTKVPLHDKSELSSA
jgi:hypothetical protein